MDVIVDGTTYRFFWEHNSTRGAGKRYTRCCVHKLPEDMPALRGPNYSTYAWCHPKDQYVKEKGRVLSLERVANELAKTLLADRVELTQIEKKHRAHGIVETVMTAYFHNKKPSPVLKPQVSDIIRLLDSNPRYEEASAAELLRLQELGCRMLDDVGMALKSREHVSRKEEGHGEA